MVAGYTDSYGAGNFDFLLMKLTSTGTTTWSKTYGGTNEDRALSLQVTSDNGFILGGKTLSYGGGNSDYFLVKTDASGTLSWAKAYGGTALDQAYSVVQTTDGGYALTGYANSYGAGSKDGYLIKTDANGVSGCSEVAATPTTNSPSVTASSAITTNNGVSVVTPTTAVRKTTMSVGTQCFTAGNTVCPVNAAFTSSATTICQGATVTFTNTTTGGAIGQGWYENNTLFSTLTSTQRTFNNQGSFTIQLIATNGTCQDTATATITVNPSVTPAVSITSNPPSPICAGTSVTFTATPVNGGTPTYQWYNGANLIPNVSGATYTTTGLTNGAAISVVMTSTAACASPATATSNTITYTVNPSVTPAVSITSNPPSPICAGTSVTFTATPVNGGTPTYQWYNGANLIPNVSGATYTTTGLTNGAAISVVMTSTASCASPATPTSNTITYTVNPSVTPAVSITSNPPSPICAGTSVTFTATPVNGGTPTYQWYNGVTLIPNVSGATYTTTGLTNGAAISVVMTSTASCASPATATSNTITYNVLNAPVASFTTSANTICAGATVTFTNTTTGAIGQTWDENNVLFSTAASPTRTFNTAGSYQILLTSTNGTCQDTATTTIVVNSIVAPSVTVSSLPQSPICAGTCVTFTATSGNGGNNPVYSWTINNAPVGQNSATYTTCTLTNNDVVTVTLTSDAACASPATATSSPVTYTVNPIPAQPIITINGDSLQSSSATGNQWFLVSNPNVLGTNQIYTPTQDGYYSVSFTDANGCTSLSDSVYFDVTSINEQLQNTGIAIYPNPANDVITLSTNKHHGATYSLFDGLGRVVLSGNFTAENTNINISGLAPGMYILTVNGDNSRSYKVMKQ
ncbi:MAG: T9SS type A sorting domain-containing protein [Sphingobacteriales bacterium JAD_PAG50586_3]|nr:MAG: T9SS type A sorting domain-containing protein [Sphingobacteriales bacterium JAD_PAG50586_3]